MEVDVNPRLLKSIATKAIRLQPYLNAYHRDGKEKKESIDKFIYVWGEHLAGHFLSKYDDAESLIWALDDDNFKLFIEKF